MNPALGFPLATVDVGNSRVKLALFDEATTTPGVLPSPSAICDLDPRSEPWERMLPTLDGRSADSLAWAIGSVERRVSSKLVEWLRDRGATRITLLAAGDLPLVVALPRPDMVGIDRLLGAVAANHLRSPSKPAVVVDLGTAITVDLVGADGAFRGGAILPGIGMAARAMHHFTDLLPLVDLQTLSAPPPAVGTGTVQAMTSGLFWGTVGGVTKLIELMAREAGSEPEVFLTGGAAPSVARLLPGTARFEANLVPAGIALTAVQKSS